LFYSPTASKIEKTLDQLRNLGMEIDVTGFLGVLIKTTKLSQHRQLESSGA